MGVLVDSPPVVTATADNPEDTFEWLPLGGQFSGDGDWCDLSTFVQSFSHDRVWNYATGRFDATMTVRLMSDSRIFDATHTTGPWYGMLRPGKQIRRSCTWAGTWYPQWRGQITSISPSVFSAADNLFVTTITARGGFVGLQQAKLTRTPYEAQIASLVPEIYLRFDDAARCSDSSGKGNHATWLGGSPTFVDGMLADDPSKAWSVAGGVYARGTHTLTTTTGLTYDFWIKTTATSGSIFQIQAGLVVVMGYIHTNGKLRFWTSSTSTYYESTNAINDGQQHHVEFYIGAPTRLKIDGVEDSTYASAPIGTPPQSWSVSNLEYIVGGSSANNDPFVGTLDEFVIVAQTGITSNYATGTAPWDGDTTGTRIGRILDMVGWPASLRDIDTGDSTMQSFAYTADMTALDAILQAADTELGLTGITKDGKVLHVARSALFAETRFNTSQATFGDGRGAATLRYVADSFDLSVDHEQVRNPISADRAGGVRITAEDTALSDPNVNGQHGWAAPTAYDRSDAVMRDRASYLLTRYKAAKTRVKNAIVKPYIDTATHWPQALGRELGDRTTWQRTPLGQGAETSITQWLDSIRASGDRAVAASYKTGFSGVPTDDTNYAIYNDGTVYDDGTVYAY